MAWSSGTTTTCTQPARSCCGAWIEPTRLARTTTGRSSWSTPTRNGASSSGGSRTSKILDGLQAALLDGRLEVLEIGLVLVRVGLGEVAHRAIEGIPLAEVGGDRHPVAGASMRPRERPAAELSVQPHRRRSHPLHLGGALAVPELADVEVAADPLRSRRQPAEEDVAGGLHQP